jgi:hypothetical protein
MELLGDVSHVESYFDLCVVTVLASVKDRGSVCVKRTIGS